MLRRAIPAVIVLLFAGLSNAEGRRSPTPRNTEVFPAADYNIASSASPVVDSTALRSLIADIRASDPTAKIVVVQAAENDRNTTASFRALQPEDLPKALTAAVEKEPSMIVYAAASMGALVSGMCICVIILLCVVRLAPLFIRSISRARWRSGYRAGTKNAQAMYERGKEDMLKEIQAGKHPWR